MESTKFTLQCHYLLEILSYLLCGEVSEKVSVNYKKTSLLVLLITVPFLSGNIYEAKTYVKERKEKKRKKKEKQLGVHGTIFHWTS